MVGAENEKESLVWDDVGEVVIARTCRLHCTLKISDFILNANEKLPRENV